MNKREVLTEEYPDIELLFADDLDEAIIGVDVDSFNADPRVVYSINKCIAILIKDGLTREEALEHFYFNISGAYMGEKTPIWVNEIISEISENLSEVQDSSDPPA